MKQKLTFVKRGSLIQLFDEDGVDLIIKYHVANVRLETVEDYSLTQGSVTFYIDKVDIEESKGSDEFFEEIS